MQVVELFRLFRETEFAESLGDSFIIPTMCGTGGDPQVRLLGSLSGIKMHSALATRAAWVPHVAGIDGHVCQHNILCSKGFV